MTSERRKPPEGEIRQSQILTTFGPGAMVDLPEHSVLIGGLNNWSWGSGPKKAIHDERLKQEVAKLLNVPSIELCIPPAANRDLEQRHGRTGIASVIFPGWFVARIDDTWRSPTGQEYRTRPLLPWSGLDKGKFLNENRKRVPVVPVRFVQACIKGHISDINWYAFVHDDFRSTCRSLLWLDEGGTGDDFSDIFVRCQACRSRRRLSDATLLHAMALGFCNGERPWLGKHASELCDDPDATKRTPNRLLVRSASNSYFPQLVSVISLPRAEQDFLEAVDALYEDVLRYADGEGDIRHERKKDRVRERLEGFSDAEVWAEVERRKSKRPKPEKTIKQAEIETLLSQPDSIGADVPEGDFYARNHPFRKDASSLTHLIDRIVLVHRLREVIAQIGFTRFEPAIPDIDGELKLDVKPAALDIDMTWVPAIENKGEGIFISFEPSAINTWLAKESVIKRGRALADGFAIWRQRKGLKEEQFQFPGLPYIMLHTLSHLLITTLSLECGYSASAIRERIYAGPYGYGILLYTGSPGSEGTLGGLVQEGKRMDRHLASAVERGKLCSSDPVCAGHSPDETYEERFLHGAACHGCVLIAETCCERRNEFLDRALVVATVDGLGAEFFPSAGV